MVRAAARSRPCSVEGGGVELIPGGPIVPLRAALPSIRAQNTRDSLSSRRCSVRSSSGPRSFLCPNCALNGDGCYMVSGLEGDSGGTAVHVVVAVTAGQPDGRSSGYIATVAFAISSREIGVLVTPATSFEVCS